MNILTSSYMEIHIYPYNISNLMWPIAHAAHWGNRLGFELPPDASDPSCSEVGVAHPKFTISTRAQEGGSGLNVRNPKRFQGSCIFFQKKHKINQPEKPGKIQEMAGKNRENSWFGDLSIFVWKLMVSGGSWHIPDDMCTRSFRPPFGLLIELNLKLIARWEKTWFYEKLLVNKR